MCSQVCAQLVRPLLAMSHLLQRQVEQLGGLLGRKDAEIQDFRENGATLSRGTHSEPELTGVHSGQRPILHPSLVEICSVDFM